MEFFGIGMPEFMMILVIAIVIFGPDKIPQMASQVGKAVRDFRRYTSELTKEFNDATGGLKDEFTSIASDIRGELAQAQADLRSQLDLTDVLRMDDPASVAVAATTEVAATAEIAASAEPAALPMPEPVVPPAPSNGAQPATDMAPSAESLTAAPSDVMHTNGQVAETPILPVATKADPFADLALLDVDSTTPADVTTYVATEPFSLASPSIETVPAPEPTAEPVLAANGTNGTNGHTPRVGGSVAGSKYARRRSA